MDRHPSPSRSLRTVFISLALAPAAAGCSMTGVNGLQGNVQRLPATNLGQTAYPPPASLTPVPFTAQDWSTVEAGKLTPTCDARGAKPVADPAGMARAKELLERWDKLGGQKGGSATAQVGEKGKAEATITISTPVASFQSGSLECDGEKAALVVNGASVPFDLAYATTAKMGARPDDLALMLTALSTKTGALVSIVVRPSTQSGLFAMTDLHEYLGASPAEPVVYCPAGPTGGLFPEQYYLFKPAAAGEPGTYVLSRQSGSSNSSDLSVGRFSLQ